MKNIGPSRNNGILLDVTFRARVKLTFKNNLWELGLLKINDLFFGRLVCGRLGLVSLNRKHNIRQEVFLK